MALTIDRRRLAAHAPAASELVTAHIAGGRAAFARRDGNIAVVDLDTGAYVRSWLRPSATSVVLSPSGRRLLVHGPNALSCELLSLDDGASLATFQRIGRQPQTVNASFLADRSGDEILLLSREDFVLEGFRAADAAAVFRIECRRPIVYYFADPVAMLDGDTIIALGSQPSESKDSFYRFSLALCRDDPAAASRMDPANTAPAEYAYRVAVGPCGRDALVAFRDEQGDEQEEDTLEDGEVHEDPLHGFSGLYVRRLADLVVLDRIAYDAPIRSGAPLMATADAVIVGRGAEVDIIARGVPEPDVLTITAGPGARYLLEPTTGAIFEVNASGQIEAITARREA